MAENYYAIITDVGKKAEAAAVSSGQPLKLTHFVVGDGGGVEQVPLATRTALVNEKYRGEITSLKISHEQDNQVMAQLVLPSAIGGFTLREIGLITSAGELFSIANSPAIDKPIGGIAVNMTYRLAVSETENITLKVATGDGVFLRQDANLSDVNDVAKARDNLELGGSSVLNVGKLKNTVAAGDDERIVKALLTSGNLNGLDDTNKALANIGAYPLVGGEVKGEVWSKIVNNYRIISNNRGAFWRFDGSTMYLMFTDDGSPTGGWNNLRPMSADYATGNLSTGHNFYAGNEIRAAENVVAGNNVYSGNGASQLSSNGNVYGAVWGGWLSDWLNARLSERISSMRLAGFGTATNGNNDNSFANAPDGAVVVGVTQKTNYTAVNYRYQQMFVNGIWMNVGVA